MKLQSANIIFILGAMGFVGMANGLCLVRNTTTPNQYWYQCFRSVNYLADLEKAPVDIHGYGVTNSKIPTIRNGSFTRLSKSLERLTFFYCGVEEIEDHAFRGLTKLTMLALFGNKLEIIKSEWFEGLSSLKQVSFQGNRIKHIDDDFFSTLPPLDILDISNNQLTCLPISSFGNFNTSEFQFQQNRFTWTCQVLIKNWLKDKEIQVDIPNVRSLEPPYDLVKMCLIKLPTPRLDEEFLNNCAEETSRQLLPAKVDYTVGQVCEFLKGKPSPFLDCTK